MICWFIINENISHILFYFFHLEFGSRLLMLLQLWNLNDDLMTKKMTLFSDILGFLLIAEEEISVHLASRK